MGKEEKKKMEQKDELTNSGQRFPVEQVSNTGKPTKKQVKAAVKELNPDVNSLEEFYKLKYCSTVVYMVPRA